MSYRRIALILLSGLIIWCFSKISGVPSSNAAEGARVAIAPMPAPDRQLLTAVIRKLYFPLITRYTPPAPPAPGATTSRYIVTASLNTVYTAGCNQGQAGESGTVILDFGYPYYYAPTNDYGAALLPAGTVFVDSLGAENLAWEFMSGWLNCAPANNTLEVALGLNNSSFAWQFTSDQATGHGADWAAAVADLDNTVRQNANMAGRISVAGAMDIEFPYNTASITRHWVDGFTPGWRTPFYNFGSCDSCPWFQYPTWQPSNSWTTEDIYYVSSRTSSNGTSNLAFPEIYKSDGENADQWYRVSLYGINAHSIPLFFRGELTQYYACQDNNNWQSCVNAGTINTPEQGWTQLWQALNTNWQTAIGGPYVSSDIRWDPTKVR